MPELRHSVEGKKFDIMESEVVSWMVANPSVREWMWQQVKDSIVIPTGAIVFDASSRTWKGNPKALEKIGETAKMGRPKKYDPEVYFSAVASCHGNATIAAVNGIVTGNRYGDCKDTRYRLLQLVKAGRIKCTKGTSGPWLFTVNQPEITAPATIEID